MSAVSAEHCYLLNPPADPPSCSKACVCG
jgi:hypothetical protein